MDAKKTTFPRPLKVKGKYRTFCAGFPGGAALKNLPAMQETQEMWDGSLGQENPLEKEMTTHSSILAWRIPWTGEPDGLKSMGVTESWT